MANEPEQLRRVCPISLIVLQLHQVLVHVSCYPMPNVVRCGQVRPFYDVQL